jgi:hypothetical protein
MDPWEATRIELGRLYRARVGPLSLWLRRSDDEIHIAPDRADVDADLADCEPLAEAPVPDGVDPDWARWVVGEGADSLRLAPALPDRAVVVRPESTLTLPTGREALFLVSIPVWVRVSISGDAGLDLCEHPTTVLSNIWFGDPMSGELCYSLRTRARRGVEDSPPRGHRAICPVRIRNDAPKPLEVERFCVRVQHLRIYAGQRLWTSEVRVRFRGEEQASEVHYAPEAPSLEPVGGVVGDAREPVAPDSLLKKTLGGLRYFGGIQ